MVCKPAESCRGARPHPGRPTRLASGSLTVSAVTIDVPQSRGMVRWADGAAPHSIRARPATICSRSTRPRAGLLLTRRQRTIHTIARSGSPSRRCAAATSTDVIREIDASQDQLDEDGRTSSVVGSSAWAHDSAHVIYGLATATSPSVLSRAAAEQASISTTGRRSSFGHTNRAVVCDPPEPLDSDTSGRGAGLAWVQRETMELCISAYARRAYSTRVTSRSAAEGRSPALVSASRAWIGQSEERARWKASETEIQPIPTNGHRRPSMGTMHRSSGYDQW